MFAAPLVARQKKRLDQESSIFTSGLDITTNDTFGILEQLRAEKRMQGINALVDVFPMGDAGLEYGKIAEKLLPLVMDRESNTAVRPTYYALENLVVYPSNDVLYDCNRQGYALRNAAYNELLNPDNFDRFRKGERLPAFTNLAKAIGVDISPRPVSLYVIARSDNRAAMCDILSHEGLYTAAPSYDTLEELFTTPRYCGLPPFSEVFFAQQPNPDETGRNNDTTSLAAIKAWAVLTWGDVEGSIISRDKALSLKLWKAIDGKLDMRSDIGSRRNICGGDVCENASTPRTPLCLVKKHPNGTAPS